MAHLVMMAMEYKVSFPEPPVSNLFKLIRSLDPASDSPLHSSTRASLRKLHLSSAVSSSDFQLHSYSLPSKFNSKETSAPQWGDRLWLWIVRKAPTLELNLELWKQRNRNGSSIHEKGKPKRERHIPLVILRGSSYIFLLLAKCNLYYKRLPPSEALGTSIWQQCRHC